MTVIKLDPNRIRQPLSPQQRLNAYQYNIANYGTPDEQFAPPEEPDPVSWGQWWKATWRTSGASELGGAIVRTYNRFQNPDVDYEFNPYTFLKERKTLLGMDYMQELVARDYFANSTSEDMFWEDYARGRDYLRDHETLSRDGALRSILTFGVHVGSDPLNLIPLGFAAKFGEGGKLLKQFGIQAGVGAGVGLTAKEIYDQIEPLNEQPGVLDDTFAMLISAGMFGGLNTLLRPTSNVLRSSVNKAYVKAVQKDYTSLLHEPSVRVLGDADIQGDVTMGAAGIIKSTLGDAIQASERQLQRALDEPIMERTVAPLRREGDRASEMLAQLKEKHEAAGVELHVVDHPDQPFYDLMDEMKQILESDQAALDATPEDLGYGLISRGLYAISSRYGALQGKVTPTGRLSRVMLSRVADVHRTLSDSIQTVSKGSVRSPFDHDAGTSAGAIREQLYTKTSRLIVNGLRAVHGKAKKEGRTLSYNGAEFKNYKTFRSATLDLLRRENAAALGYKDLPVPKDVDPLVREAADATRKHFLDLRDELERHGFLSVGPRALKSAYDEMAVLEQKLDTMRTKAANTTPREASLYGPDSYSLADIEERLNNSLPGGMDANDPIRAAQDTLSSHPDADFDGTIVIHPDAVKDMSGLEIARLKQAGVRIGEDDSTTRAILGDSRIDAILSYAANGRKGLLYNHIDYILHHQEDFDPEIVLDAALYHQRKTWAANQPKVKDPTTGKTAKVKLPKHIMVDPESLKAGDTFRIFGEEHTVQVGDDGLFVDIDGVEFYADEITALPIEEASLQNRNAVRVLTEREAKAEKNRISKRIERQEARIGKAQARIGELEKAVNLQSYYLPHVYNISAVLKDPEGFQNALIDGWREQDGMIDGTPMPLDEQRLRPEVAMKLNQNELGDIVLSRFPDRVPIPDEGEVPKHVAVGRVVRPTDRNNYGRVTKVNADEGTATVRFVNPHSGAVAYKEFTFPELRPAFRSGKNGPTKTDIRQYSELIEGARVGDLSDAQKDFYLQELESFYERNAKHAYDTITDRKELTGVLEASSLSESLKRRIMQIDESKLARFMEQDLEEVLQRYDRTVGGQLAVAKAIRLHPNVWEGKTLKDGTPITRGEHLSAYLHEMMKTWRDFAAHNDNIPGRKKLMPKVEKWQSRITKDIDIPLRVMEGRTNFGFDDPAHEVFNFFGRNAMRHNFMSKLGSSLFPQLNDYAAQAMMMLNPRWWGNVVALMLRDAKKLPKEDLEIMGMTLDQIARARSLGDVDFATTGRGYGTGRTKRITVGIDQAYEKGGNVFARATMLTKITAHQKQLAMAELLNRIRKQSRQMLKAREYVDQGMEQAAALRKAGLGSYDAARLNKLGFNTERARWWHDQTYRHGLLTDDTYVRDSMTFDEYLDYKKMVKPNYAEWDISDDAAKDMFDLLTANLSNEVDRHLVVTPGVFDRPLINQRFLGRMFNQFQGFMLAFANQRIAPMAQMPASHQLWYGVLYTALGGIADAIQAHVSGRRSMDKSIEQWTGVLRGKPNNTLAMMYLAWDRSGLSGWLGRPLSTMDRFGIPWSPGRFLGAEPFSSASGHGSTQDYLTLGGPVAADIDRLFGVFSEAAKGDFDRWWFYNAWKLMPYQNLLWFRLAHRFTDAPVVPEALIEDQFDEDKKGATMR